MEKKVYSLVVSVWAVAIFAMFFMNVHNVNALAADNEVVLAANDKSTNFIPEAEVTTTVYIYTVCYQDLEVGKAYTIEGRLKDEASNQFIEDSNGNDIFASRTFVATEPNGTMEIRYNITSDIEITGAIEFCAMLANEEE